MGKRSTTQPQVQPAKRENTWPSVNYIHTGGGETFSCRVQSKTGVSVSVRVRPRLFVN